MSAANATSRRTRRTRANSRTWVAALAAGIVHCGDTDRLEQPGAVLHMTWTIDDTTLPSGCDALGATDFGATLFYRGDVVSSYEAACTAFELTTDSITPNGEYMVRATLVDDLDVAKSRTVTSSMMVLAPGEVRELMMNFDTDTLIDQRVDPIEQ